MKKDITNLKFNLLTVLEFIEYRKVGTQGKRRSYWICKCECGNTKEVSTGDLTSGNVKTCGCLGIYNKNGDKKCTECNNFIELKNYYKNDTACKKCSNERKKRYITKEEYNKRQRKSYQNNKEKRLKYAKSYREKNKEKVLKNLKLWKEKNPEYKKNRWKNDLNFRLKENLRGRIYKAVKNNSKSKKTQELIGCSIEELKNYIFNLFQKEMSWDNYGEWHIDHIIPCAKFDLSKEEEQKKCFHFSNLQPLWKQDNMEKSAKIF